MDELYEYMKKKHDESFDKGGTVEIEYAEFARLYQLVCYMRQIKAIANGWE